jgi:hypothetical protein
MEIVDADGNNMGDGYPPQSNKLIVGEVGVDGPERRAFIVFRPNDAQRQGIIYSEYVHWIWPASSSNVDAFEVELMGLFDRSTNALVYFDFESPAELLMPLVTGTPLGGNIPVVVTEFAKTEAARSKTSPIIFRLEIFPDVPNADGLCNQYVFHSANSTRPPSMGFFRGIEPIVLSIRDLGADVELSWTGGEAPYTVERTYSLSDPNWVPILNDVHA